jgi:predicted Zn-dependent protease
MRFPSGWKKQNTRSSVMASEPNGAAQMQLTLVDPNGASPSADVDGLVRAGKVASIDGRSTTVGGFDSWVGRLRVVGSNNVERVLASAFVSRSDRQMFEILGASAASGDANEDAIFSSIRTFRVLDDPAKLSVTPNRVHLVRVSQGGTFNEVIARVGSAITPEETSILNNVEGDEEVRAGETIKTVERGRR